MQYSTIFGCDYFDMPISNAATEVANGAIRRLIVNSVGGVSFEMLRLRVRARTQTGGRHRFHCATCRKLVDDYAEKRSRFRTKNSFIIFHEEDNEISLCRQCKRDNSLINVSDLDVAFYTGWFDRPITLQ
jgi:hypothetical protein